MSILTRIKQYISPTGEQAVNDVPAIVGDIWSRHSFTPVTNWPAAYAMWKANPIAQGCTLAYSLMMPEAQIGVIQPNGDYDFEQPIVELLTRDQWRVTMSEIMTILCIGGNAYGYKLRNGSGAVIGIRWYTDKRFAPVNDGWGDVAYYLYYDGMQTYRVEKTDVVHLVGFWYDPEKPMGGGSPIDMASQSIEGFNEASATVFNIHKNDAMPKTVVIYDEELTTEQIAAAERTFKRKYGGDRRGAVGHMWGIKDIKRLALDWAEMCLSDTFGQYETRICGVYRVHPIIAFTHAGMATSTYSNFEQASKDFTTMSRVPFWNLLAEQLNAQLAIPDFGVQIGFDLSTVQALAGQAIASEAIGMTDDDISDDSPDNGDVQTLSLKGGAAVTAAPFRKVAGDQPSVIVDIDTEEPKTVVVIGPETKAWLHSTDDQVYVKAYDELLTKASVKIARQWGRALDKLYKSITGTKSLELKIDDFSLDVWEREFADATEGSREELVALVLRLAAEEVNSDAPEGEFGKARREGMQRSADMISESVGTIRTEVQELIVNNPRLSESELSGLLKEKFESLKMPVIPTVKQSRAELIARTTATATTGTVQKNVWDEIGGIRRQWAALAGARPEHDAAHGTFEDANGNFTVGGEVTPYPSGPGLSAWNAVNCRCFARATRT
jgi:HK97 family phage portal protein